MVAGLSGVGRKGSKKEMEYTSMKMELARKDFGKMGPELNGTKNQMIIEIIV